jgi:hypothetical protein
VETSSDHYVAVVETFDEPIEFGGFVLTISVNLNDAVIALTVGIEKCGPHGTADTDVEGQIRNSGSSGLGNFRSRIG